MASGSIAAALKIPGVVLASSLMAKQSPFPTSDSRTLTLDDLRGQVVEILAPSEGAGLSIVVPWLVQAQQEEAPVAWITTRDSLPHPHDLQEAGLDPGAIALLQMSSTTDAYKAASHLLESGAFGLILLQVMGRRPARLSVCQKHAMEARASNSTLIHLSDPQFNPNLRTNSGPTSTSSCNPSDSTATGAPLNLPSPLYPGASLRLGVSLQYERFDHFQTTLSCLKDRHCGNLWQTSEAAFGLHGLR